MEERKIKKSTFLPVFLGIREDKVKGGHEEDVGGDEDEEGEVVAGAEWVGEQNQDEEATNDREEDGKKQNTPEKSDYIKSFILMHKILQVAGIIHPLMCLK